jgi:hypothetical protein
VEVVSMTAPPLDREAPSSRPEDLAPVRASPLADRLTLVVAALIAMSATVGLAEPDLYQDEPGLRGMFRGYDLISLVVAVPTMLLALRSTRRGSGRARLVLLGALGFTVYNYALYVFGAAFNDLFLAHVAILVMATVALAVELLHLGPEPSAISRRSYRLAAGLLTFLGVGLGAMWVFNAVRFAITGETPVESELVVPLAATHLGYALDLAVLVPAYLGAAWLLWRHRPWGAPLGAVLFVAGLGQQLAYMTALVFQARADIPEATAFDPGEPLIVAAYAIGAALLLRRSQVADLDTVAGVLRDGHEPART